MTILRDITNDKHREVENLPFIQKLLKGELTKDEYVFYLYELKYIYKMIEDTTKSAGLLEGLTDIERTNNITKDLEELSPGYTRELLNSTKEYIQYLSDLYFSPEKRNLLFAHVYVRHMGDLYGGKLIARTVPGEGRAYQFEDRPGLIKQFNSKLYIELGDEANRAFDWFIQIFGEMGEKLGYANLQISK
jgi:heme oxygenase